MIKSQRKSEKGFMALMTAMVLSLVLMLGAVTLNQSEFFIRSSAADAEYKARSVTLARACVTTALAKLAADSVYAGNETIRIAVDACHIRSITLGSSVGQYTIETHATVGGAATNLRIVARAADLSIVSWNEISSF